MTADQDQPLVLVTLPPDGASPAAARRHMRAALRVAGLDPLADDALLLVTELVTNAVVHAGTAVELLARADGDGLLVEVTDHSPSSAPVVRRDPNSGREGGRGLFLLDALAESWGTTHHSDRKSLWFRLGGSDVSPPAPSAPLVEAPVADVPATLGWLLAVRDQTSGRLAPEQVLGELLHRLADALRVDRAALVVESDAEPDTWTVAAARGEEPSPDDIADLRRGALASEEPVLLAPGRTVVQLRGRGGALGALVLDAVQLDPAATVVARLAAERLSLVLRDQRAEMAQHRSRGSLALLAEASDLFAATLDVQLAVTLAAQLVVPRLAQWSAVYSISDRGAQLAAVAHEDEEEVAGLRVGLSGSRGEQFAARLARDLSVQRPALVGRAQVAELLGPGERGDVLALPLVARRRLLGGLLVARPRGQTYTAEDVSLLLDLARRAALAVDNARLYEERTGIARALQASLLPPDLPRAPEVDFGARYTPAGEGNEVGGDFYDVFALPHGGWAVAIGDVCGKGAEAAAITGLARNVIRLLAREGRAPAQVLGRLNDAVLELGDRGRFCTAALAVARPDRAGGLEVVHCSGGHPPPVLLSADRPPSLVGRSGTVLGVVEAPDLEDERLTLAPGESLVLYTDGVTERRSGRHMFGDETLLRVLAGQAGRPADAVAGRLETEVRAFSNEPSRDDLAVLVVRATGSRAPAPRPIAAITGDGPRASAGRGERHPDAPR
jgi:phosphoserine phosphatase RsbU/P